MANMTTDYARVGYGFVGCGTASSLGPYRPEQVNHQAFEYEG